MAYLTQAPVESGRRHGLWILGSAAQGLALHIWLTLSVLVPLERASAENLLVSANFATLVGCMLVAYGLVFGVHAFVRFASRRCLRANGPAAPGLFSSRDVAWARPLVYFAASLLALSSLVPGLIHFTPVLSYVVVDLRWWWTLLIGCWTLATVDQRLGHPMRDWIRRIASNAPPSLWWRAPAVLVVAIGATWVVASTPNLRFASAVHGDEPAYLRYCEMLYQGVGFDLSRLQPAADVPAPRVWRNFAHLAKVLPSDLRQLAADARAWVVQPSRTFNRARVISGNFLRGKDGGVYHKHQPGLSFLLCPAYFLDRHMSGVPYRSDWPSQLRAVNTFFLVAYLAWALFILGVLLRLGYTRPISPWKKSVR